MNPRPTDYEGVAALLLFQQVPRKCVTSRACGSFHVSHQSRWGIPFSTAQAEKGKRVSAALTLTADRLPAAHLELEASYRPAAGCWVPILCPKALLPEAVEGKGFEAPPPPKPNDLAVPPLHQAAPDGIPRPPASTAGYPTPLPQAASASSGPSEQSDEDSPRKEP